MGEAAEQRAILSKFSAASRSLEKDLLGPLAEGLRTNQSSGFVSSADRQRPALLFTRALQYRSPCGLGLNVMMNHPGKDSGYPATVPGSCGSPSS
jgi:hypothetical protein